MNTLSVLCKHVIEFIVEHLLAYQLNRIEINNIKFLLQAIVLIASKKDCPTS